MEAERAWHCSAASCLPLNCQHFDSGRSEEAAEVVFQQREDALAAMKRYNNLALDNKPMKIELVENGLGSMSEGMTLSSGIRYAS